MSNFDDVLAQCLAAVETGQATIEECLSRFPQHAAALRPLLRTALALRAAPAVEPSPAFAAAAQTRLLNVIAARQQPAGAQAEQPRTQPARRWGAVIARALIAVVIASFALAGTAYAARDSLPDSPLYPVKRTVEQVQVAVAPNDARKARVFLGLMDRRAMETAAMIRSGKLERTRQTTLLYIRILRDAAMVIERVPANRPEGRAVLVEMRDHLAAQQVVFQRLVNSAPETSRPLLRTVLTALQRTINRLNARLAST